MNFEFFAFMLFMSISSFALAFIAYILLTKAMGKESRASRFAQIIFIPGIVVAYDMVTFTAPADYQYLLAALPIAGVIGLLLYSVLYKGKDTAEEVPQKRVPLRNEEKKFSKKSARIHAAREKRGRK